MDLKLIQAVQVIVTHAHCPDGVGSAILLHDALPDAEIVFLRPGSEEYKSYPARPGMLFCDISPPVGRVQEFVDAGALVLDHHKGAKDVVLAFGERGVFADERLDPGVSGAVLAFRHVWDPIKNVGLLNPEGAERVFHAEYFAKLVGVRDTFVRNDLGTWNDACAQAEVLHFYPASDWLSLKDPFGPQNEVFWAGRRGLGQFLLTKSEARTKQTIEEGFKLKTERGHSVLIFQNLGPATDVGAVTQGVFDVIVGFRYYMDGAVPKFQVSMRSQGVIDVASICQKYGGGGHTNAAGASMDFMMGVHSNPIEMIMQILNNNGA